MRLKPVLVVLIIGTLLSCGKGGGSSTTDSTPDRDISSLTLRKTVEIVNASRPEIIVTPDRVFVLYLNISPARSFNVTIYNRDMTAVLSTAMIVPTDPVYGGPTDIRVVSDGVSLYAFYETCNDGQNKTYLFGAKYRLDDALTRTAYTGAIAQSTKFTVATAGDEKLDDPAPLLGNGEVFVMTRIKSTLAQSGETIYRFRKFSNDLQPLPFSPGAMTYDLDLSLYSDGEARQSSILFADGFYYVAVQTAVGPSSINNDAIIWSIPANVLLVKLDANFVFVESGTVSAESGYADGYVTGLKADSRYFYLTYNHVKLGMEFSSVIKILDKSLNPVVEDKYRTVVSSALRPSIEVTTDQVFAGNDDETGSKAVIYIFDKQ